MRFVAGFWLFHIPRPRWSSKHKIFQPPPPSSMVVFCLLLDLSKKKERKRRHTPLTKYTCKHIHLPSLQLPARKYVTKIREI